MIDMSLTEAFDAGLMWGLWMGVLIGIVIALGIEYLRHGRLYDDYDRLQQEMWADIREYDEKWRKYDDREQMEDQRTS